MQRPGLTTLGIVLAGGGSTRLADRVTAAGGGKASLIWQGRSFLEHVVAAVSAVTTRTIVVAAPGQMLPPIEGVEIVRDTMPGAGPLAGIRDGLRSAAETPGTALEPRLAFVASCDLPRLRPEIVRLLVDAAAYSDALWTVPCVHGHRQVLVSVVDVAMLPRIDAWLAAGRRDPRGLLADLACHDPRSVCEVTEEACRTVDPGLVSFDDIDTPDDLERLEMP